MARGKLGRDLTVEGLQAAHVVNMLLATAVSTRSSLVKVLGITHEAEIVINGFSLIVAGSANTRGRHGRLPYRASGARRGVAFLIITG